MHSGINGYDDVNQYYASTANGGSTIDHFPSPSSSAYQRLQNYNPPSQTCAPVYHQQYCPVNGGHYSTGQTCNSSRAYGDRGVSRSPVNFREGRRSSDGLVVAQHGVVAFQQKLYHKEKVYINLLLSLKHEDII